MGRTRIDFKETCCELVLEEKTYSFEYTNLLKHALIKHNVKITFRMWNLLILKINTNV